TTISCPPKRLLALSVSLTLSALPTYAENTPRKAKSVIEEVIVTAQKREESVNDVPISISAFSGDTLDALGVTDTRDLGKMIPGFTASENGYNTPVYTLRGVGFNDTTYTATSTVGVYIDEISLPYSIMTKGTNLDISRVEVLKGPQGTLFGRNTTGGAINYVANKPGEQTEGNLSVTYGKYHSTEIEGAISAPLSEDLSIRFAAKDIRSQEGWQTSITRHGDRLGKVDKQSLRLTLGWAASESLDITASASGWRDRSEPQAPQPVAIRSGNPFVGEAALAPQVRNHPTVADSDDPAEADWAPDYKWRLNDSFYQFSLRADWYPREQMQIVSLTSYGKVISDDSSLPGSGLSVVNSEQVINANVSTFSQEVRLHREFADVNWVVGLNYNVDDGREDHLTYVDTISLLFPDPVTGRATVASRAGARGDTQATSTSVFSSADWLISDSWTATLGLRYSRESRDYMGCSYEPEESSGTGTSNVFTLLSAQRALQGGQPPATIEKEECFTLDENGSNAIFTDILDENNIALRSVLSWTPDDESMYYISLVQGFKSGGYPVLNGSDQKQLEPVTQEKLVALELGSKTSLTSEAIQLNTAVFAYDYTDKQLLTRIDDPVFGPLPILQNAPASRIYGAEMDLQIQPTAGLFLSLALGYTDSEIEEFSSFDINGQPRDFSGRPFNFAPLWQGALLADYNIPLTNDWDFGMSVDYSYSSETNSTIEGDANYHHDESSVFGGRLRLTSVDEKWKVVLSGRNITNEFSTVGVFQIGDSVARYTEQGRSYAIAVTYQYL
ncbi:MAG: TonB-dependent receptor, partial [Spongiibacter sp.]|nr:TonB-dependent receptor [Spongiibacter sp.]